MRTPIFMGKCSRCLTLDCGREIYNISGDKGCYGCLCETGIEKERNKRLDEFFN